MSDRLEDNSWYVEIHCPHCGAQMDAAVVVGPVRAIPQDGDAIMCFDCFAICIVIGLSSIGRGLLTRKPTAAEQIELDEFYGDVSREAARFHQSHEPDAHPPSGSPPA